MKLSENGFSLVEVLVVAVILAVVLTSMVQLFIYSSVQAQLGGEQTAAVSEAQNKVEEIRGHDFDAIVTDYGVSGTPGNKFSLDQLTGMGAIYIDNSNSNLLVIDVVTSYESKYDRIIGEDANLNGVLDSGEDVNSNGKIDSPVKVSTMLTRR